MKKSLLIIGLLILVTIPSWSVPMMINVQGRLLKDGAPVANATTPVYFYLAKTENNFWVSGNYYPPANIVYVDTDSNGVFNETYTTSDFEEQFKTTDTLYLGFEIAVSPAVRLTPAQRIVAVPWAVTAKHLVGGTVSAEGGAGVGVKGRGGVAGGSFESTAASSIAVKGVSAATNSIGVYGKGGAVGGSFESTSGYGVYGKSSSNYGLCGYSSSGNGVYGNSGTGYGLYGYSYSSDGIYGTGAGIGVTGVGSVIGVRGRATNYGGSFEGNVVGVCGNSSDTSGQAVYGIASALGSTTANYGGYFEAKGGKGTGVYGKVTSLTTLGNHYGGYFEATSGYGFGVYAIGSQSKGGIFGTTVSWEDPGLTDTNFGVAGITRSGNGVYGQSASSSADKAGVYGFNSVGQGVKGYSSGGTGVVGYTGSSTGFDFFASGVGVHYGQVSSIRWKQNIQSIDNPLGKVLGLRGVYFDWIKEKGGKHDMGMIAEEVGKIVPEVVQYEPDGSGYATGMDYGQLTPLLVEAIKAQQSQIEELKTKNKELEARLKVLEK